MVGLPITKLASLLGYPVRRVHEYPIGLKPRPVKGYKSSASQPLTPIMDQISAYPELMWQTKA